MAARPPATIEVYSHIRQSSFRLINWGRAAKPEEQLIQGEDNLGFNLFYGHYGTDDGRQPHPRRRRFHGQLRHERRPPDGPAPGVRLVRPLRHARRHAPRRPPGDDRPHAAQRAGRALLRRAGPDLAQAPGHRRVRPARRAGPGAGLRSGLRRRRRRRITSSIRRTPSTSPAGSTGPAGSSASWTPPGRRRSSASARCGPTSCR